jgi:hypothetical protein
MWGVSVDKRQLVAIDINISEAKNVVLVSVQK